MIDRRISIGTIVAVSGLLLNLIGIIGGGAYFLGQVDTKIQALKDQVTLISSGMNNSVGRLDGRIDAISGRVDRITDSLSRH